MEKITILTTREKPSLKEKSLKQFNLDLEIQSSILNIRTNQIVAIPLSNSKIRYANYGGEYSSDQNNEKQTVCYPIENNIKNCLTAISSLDYEIYINSHMDLKGIYFNNNECFKVLFREFKDDVNILQRDSFIEKAFNKTLTQTDIVTTTNNLGSKIIAYYGG